MRYSTAPAYDPKSGLYRGKGDGSKGKQASRNAAVRRVKPHNVAITKVRKDQQGDPNQGDPRKKVR